MTPQRTIHTDKRITFLQYLNTVLLGILTFAVGLGVNQMNEWNKSYDAIIINQSNIINNQDEIIKDMERITERCEKYNQRLSIVEAILPKEYKYKPPKLIENGK